MDWFIAKVVWFFDGSPQTDRIVVTAENYSKAVEKIEADYGKDIDSIEIYGTGYTKCNTLPITEAAFNDYK